MLRILLSFMICLLFASCYKPPTLAKEAIDVRIYRGKASLQGCSFLTEISGSINTKGYGIELYKAIQGAETILKNQAVKYGGDSVLVLHTESRYAAKDYNFKIGIGNETSANKIDEYIMYAEVYKCKN